MQFEILLRRFQRRHRRQRPDRLAVFDPFVESFARLGVAGIGKNRAMAERARSGFGRALIQRDDAVLGDHEGHQVGHGVAALWRGYIADRMRGDIGGLQRGGDVLMRRRRPQ